MVAATPATLVSFGPDMQIRTYSGNQEPLQGCWHWWGLRAHTTPLLKEGLNEVPHHYFTTPALKLNDITKIDRNFGGLVSNFNYWPQVRPYEVGAQDIQAQFLPE